MFSSFFSEDVRERRQIENNCREIVSFLAEEIGDRTLAKYEKLNRARRYVFSHFVKNGHNPREEKYVVEGKEVANIIAEIKGFDQPKNIILIGAHYDTVEGTPGADDNATAVAGLLELYRLLSRFEFKKTVRFVAFTLEEPPYFASDLMGSMKNASLCRKRKENIELMICLEMLGYASKKAKQDFPVRDMQKKYPPFGNYLGVFSLPSSAEFVYLWKKVYNAHAKHKVYDMIAPASIPGIDLSDHSSFIKNGYPAIMLSDTGYYRNKNYHGPDDTFDSINFTFLTENIMNSFITLREILNMGELSQQKS